MQAEQTFSTIFCYFFSITGTYTLSINTEHISVIFQYFKWIQFLHGCQLKSITNESNSFVEAYFCEFRIFLHIHVCKDVISWMYRCLV